MRTITSGGAVGNGSRMRKRRKLRRHIILWLKGWVEGLAGYWPLEPEAGWLVGWLLVECV